MLTQDDAIRICRLVAGLVVTDDDLDEREDAFIERMLATFGIPWTDRNLTFPTVDGGEAAAALRAMSKEMQDQAVDLLVRAAAADGKIVPEERAYLLAVAEAVGMTPEEL